MRAAGVPRAEVEDTVVSNWQTAWSSAQAEEWTRRLIPNLKEWLGREKGGLNFHTTQLMTGHGSFGKYLNRIGKRQTSRCPYRQEDDAEHTVFNCYRWEGLRHEIRHNNLTPDNLVSLLMQSNNNWDWFSNFASTVLKSKEEEERHYRR
ncbi:uncharacterized protein LOC142319830 [Lycorma delicatula]|uniref:uncharacterized protein LOC142319830 n=1 Tax=Lycorma delicatula TaxID=130591 RepID=UPI003F516AD8